MWICEVRCSNDGDGDITAKLQFRGLHASHGRASANLFPLGGREKST